MNAQEQLWSGQFGKEYIGRNKGPVMQAAALTFLARCLAKAPGVRSVLELGANIGVNLECLASLYPEAQQTAVEINPDACRALRRREGREVHQCSILDFNTAGRMWDLVLVKGVLIHIAPEQLDGVYQVIDRCTRRYLLLAEYFNPVPVAVEYRGQQGAMWKRDFASEIIEKFDGWRVKEYGFWWRHDPKPADDITWFLMERR